MSKHHCYHCGDPCDESISLSDKYFCCSGCKTVYGIISENGLSTYYSLNQNPGIKSKDSRLEFLDNEEIQKRFIVFENDTTAKVKLKLPEIHCTSCIWLLENLRKLNPAILSCKVNFTHKSASILYSKKQISLKELAQLLSAIGYTPDFTEDADKAKSRTSSNLVRKMAVAGFCFGNSMLISLPEYLDTAFSVDRSFTQYFGLINVLLSLPVLLFSARGYFKSSLSSLKHLHINMDLPIAIGIIALFSRSLFEIITETGPGYIDSLTGLVFFLLVGQWYQSKTYEALSFDRDYKSFFPIAVSKLVNGIVEHIPVEKMKKGDLILIHHDEIIPGDGEIVDGNGELDYSFITGESAIEIKKKGEKVFAGGRQKGQSVKIRIEQLVQAGHLTALWNQQSGKSEKAELEAVTNRIAPYFVSVILLLALGSGIAWYFIDSQKVWLVVSAVLIIACPCALALAAPFGLGQAMRVLGKNHLFLRSVSVVEDLVKIKSIVFDKTGTLTKNNRSEVAFSGSLTDHEKSLIYSLTAESLHPYSRALNEWFRDFERKQDINQFEEITGKGISGTIGGKSIRLGSDAFINGSKNEKGIHLEIDGVYKGVFAVDTPYRKGIIDTLKDLKSNFQLHLLSGDQDHERAFLSPYFHQLHFQQKPEDKLQQLERLRGKDQVMMIGDGLNDAGALEKADVGIAVVEDLHTFSPASDAIIKAEELRHLPDFMKFSRRAIRIIYLAFALSFMYNIVGLSFAIAGSLTPLFSAILMPISSITVVAFVSLATSFAGKKTLKLTKISRPSVSSQPVETHSKRSLHILKPV